MVEFLAGLVVGGGSSGVFIVAGCASYAEARLDRPPAETVPDVPPDWAGWIADLDDRMTGACR